MRSGILPLVAVGEGATVGVLRVTFEGVGESVPEPEDCSPVIVAGVSFVSLPAPLTLFTTTLNLKGVICLIPAR